MKMARVWKIIDKTYEQGYWDGQELGDEGEASGISELGHPKHDIIADFVKEEREAVINRPTPEQRKY